MAKYITPEAIKALTDASMRPVLSEMEVYGIPVPFRGLDGDCVEVQMLYGPHAAYGDRTVWGAVVLSHRGGQDHNAVTIAICDAVQGVALDAAKHIREELEDAVLAWQVARWIADAHKGE